MKNQIITLDKVIQVCDAYYWRNRDWLKSIDFIIGVSRGGLIPAVWIATHLNKPLITAYIDKRDRVYLDRGGWIKNMNVLIVDDVIRSGKTFEKIKEMVSRYDIKSIDSFFVFEDTNNNLRFPWDIYD